jgi:hypothetical protein
MTDANFIPSVNWELKVNVDEFNIFEQSLRVTGDTHIGGVIIQLVENLTPILRNDWSDFSLWWPDKKQWLNKTKMTLDQYGVQSDAVLTFTRTHKNIRILMPDLQIIHLNVDFSQRIFNLVKQICKDLTISHPEELSLLKPLSQVNMTNNKISSSLSSGENKDTASPLSTSNNSTLNNSSANSLRNVKEKSKCETDLPINHTYTNDNNRRFSVENFESCKIKIKPEHNQTSLMYSPVVLKEENLSKPKLKRKTLIENAKINSR